MKYTRWLPLLLAAVFTGAFADAQSRVIADQGKPGTYGPWAVTATVVASSASCASPSNKVTSVGVASGNTPSAQLASRSAIMLCNSYENSGTPLVKCRIDGGTPAMGAATPGDVLYKGDCVIYAIGAAVVPKCISDTAATATTSTECATP